ncbi:MULTISPECIES: SDR family oxidoreductase [Hydrogenophaga]|uniref:Peroxisomal trans-2-enoyl-CoA reductase n=2 Tax=Hydrogenophaga TaxID=47420 RepID=A0ABW2QN47_9BURK
MSTPTPPPSARAERYRSVFRPGLFEGQTVVVTGGGSGMGRCTAHELASLGARLALVGRKREKLEAVAAELAQAYPESVGRVTQHACDIREEASVQQTVADIVAAHGAIDGLFNCAGGQYPARLRDITLKGWDVVVRNNLHGTFLFSREVYVQWMEQHGGSIVNMLADIWGGLPGMGHSGAARGGVLNFTETAACEWGCAGVRVNAVAPGWIASAGIDTYDDEYRDLLRGLRSKVPLQRFGTESELASAVVYLLSPAAGFISGAVIRVDGGVPTARHTWKLEPARQDFAYNGFPLYEPPQAFSATPVHPSSGASS